MILIDVPFPECCVECAFMRCSKCIPKDSMPVDEFVKTKGKPEWCPIMIEVVSLSFSGKNIWNVKEAEKCLRS